MTPDSPVVRSVERDGNRLRATLRNEYSDAEETRTVDQVVVEHGTLPAAEIFHELAPLARNEGELDIEALIEGRAQTIASNEEGVRSCCSGSATRWRAGTSTPRSTTRCGCARSSDEIRKFFNAHLQAVD